MHFSHILLGMCTIWDFAFWGVRGGRESGKRSIWDKQLLACLHYTLIFTQCLPISKHSYGRLLHCHHTLDCEVFVKDLRIMCTRICTRVPTVILHPGAYCYKLWNFPISLGSDGTCFWPWVRRQTANSC